MEAYKLEALRKLAKFLRDQPDIEVVKYKKNRLQVKFNNGYYEYWSYDYHDRYDWFQFDENHLYQFDDNWPGFRCQFTRNIHDEDYEVKGKYFLYTDKYLNSFKLANKRIFINRLVTELADDYVDLWMPESHKKMIIQKVNNMNWGYIKVGPMVYREHTNIIRTLRDVLYLQDFDFSNIWNIKNIFMAIRRLIKKKKDLTRFNMFWYLRNIGVIQKAYVGFSLGLAAMLRDKFGFKSIRNHTNFKWVDISADLNGVSSTDGDIHIVERDMGFNKQIILGSGPGKLYDSCPNLDNFMEFSIKGEGK